MYPYHNRIRQRIQNGELLHYEFVEKYKQISPCLLLYFSTEPEIRPIRRHRFLEYLSFLPSELEKVNENFDKEKFLTKNDED